jgi:hypothetical protein
MTNPKEIWKPVPGYEGLYKVSNYGGIMSNNKRLSGKYIHDIKNVRLSKNGINKHMVVSHLVMRVFGDYPDSSNKVIRIGYRDGDKANLYIGNLYVSMLCDKDDHGLQNNGNNWRVLPYINKKRVYMGTYPTKEQAIAVRDTVLDIYKETGKIVKPHNTLKTNRRTRGTGSVYFNKNINKWIAVVTENKKKHCIGLYTIRKEAIAALDGHNESKQDGKYCYIYKQGNRWQVSVYIAGKYRYFGVYPTRKQAINVRNTILEIYKETGKIVYPHKISNRNTRKHGTGSLYYDEFYKRWKAKVKVNGKYKTVFSSSIKEEAEAALDEYIAKKKKE